MSILSKYMWRCLYNISCSVSNVVCFPSCFIIYACMGVQEYLLIKADKD